MAALGAGGIPFPARAEDPSDEAVRRRLLALLLDQPDAPALSLQWLDANWRDDFVPMALEIVRFVPLRSTAGAIGSKRSTPDVPNGRASWLPAWPSWRQRT